MLIGMPRTAMKRNNHKPPLRFGVLLVLLLIAGHVCRGSPQHIIALVDAVASLLCPLIALDLPPLNTMKLLQRTHAALASPGAQSICLEQFRAIGKIGSATAEECAIGTFAHLKELLVSEHGAFRHGIWVFHKVV